MHARATNYAVFVAAADREEAAERAVLRTTDRRAKDAGVQTWEALGASESVQ